MSSSSRSRTEEPNASTSSVASRDLPIPTCIYGSPGLVSPGPVTVAVTLHVDNRDPFHHTLAVEGTDLIMSLPGHESMAGTIEITE